MSFAEEFAQRLQRFSHRSNLAVHDWRTLAAGQSPRALIIACSDSRVDPALLFDARPGELFVIRDVANIVPRPGAEDHELSIVAAIEFAVTQLKVCEIVIMGHQHCGGCMAALSSRFEGAKLGAGGYVDHWVGSLAQVRDSIVAHGDIDSATALEQAVVRFSLANLREYEWVRERELAGRLRLTGLWFALEEGRLHALDEAVGVFARI